MGSENKRKDVELLELMNAIWKRKLFIIAGTLLSIAVSAIIVFSITAIYKNVMVLRPGVIDITDNGTKIYLDSASNIAALISSGAYDEKIIKSFDKETFKDNSTELTFNVNATDGADIINVEFEFSDRQVGTAVLRKLYDFLVELYRPGVETSQKKYAGDIETEKASLSNIKYQIKLLESKIVSAGVEKKNNKAVLENRITQLRSTMTTLIEEINHYKIRMEKITSEYKTVLKNSTDLSKKQSDFLENSIDKENILSAMVYNNIVQENIVSVDKLKNSLSELEEKISELKIAVDEKDREISDNLVEKNAIEENYKIKVEDLKAEIEGKKAAEKEKLASIEFIESQLKSCSNIKLIQEPLSSSFPVKPKKKMILVISAVAGLLFFLFLSVVLGMIKREI